MKGFILTAFAACLAKAVLAQTGDGSEEDIFKYFPDRLLLSIQKNAKLLDASDIDDFKEGFAIIRKGENYALINSSAQMIFPYGTYKFNIKQGYSIDRANCGFFNGMCLVRDPETEKYGFINNQMQLIVPCTLIEAEHFTADGFAWAKQLDARGKEELVYIDRQGKKYKIKDQNLYSHRWQDAYPVNSLNNSHDFYSKDGRFLFNTKRWFKGEYSGGLLQVDTNDNIRGERTGFIDLRGKLVIPYQFKGIFYSGFHEGKALFEPRTKDEFKYVYIDRKGKPVIQLNNTPEYPDLSLNRVDFYNGLAFANLGNTSILIDTLGRLIDVRKLILSRNDHFFYGFKTIDIDPVARQGRYIRFKATLTYEVDKEFVSGGIAGGHKYIQKEPRSISGVGIARLDGTIMIPPVYRNIDFPDMGTGFAKAIYEFHDSSGQFISITGIVGRYPMSYRLFEIILPNTIN